MLVEREESPDLFQWSDSMLNNQRLCVKLEKTEAKILKYQHHPTLFLIFKQYLWPMSRK